MPQYWPTWLGHGLLRALAVLPFPAQLRIGAALGSAARWVLPAHVRVARRNLAICLPELTEAERGRILREHFRCLGMTMAETAVTWWRPPEFLRSLGRVEGLEHLDRAIAGGQGAILLASHFTTLEIAAGILGTLRTGHPVYKPTKDPLVTEILRTRRGVLAGEALASDDVRAMVRALRANRCIWYAPDQAYRKKGAEMVPFFGVPVATNTATSRLARLTGARVLPFFAERLPGNEGYRLVIHPPWSDFPTGDSVADTRRHHELIEAHVRRVPAQYLWVHRRFKGLDDAYPNYYA